METFDLPKWDPSTPVTVLTQTTLSVDDTAKSVERIRKCPVVYSILVLIIFAMGKIQPIHQCLKSVARCIG